jgi:hypothetical protein
VFLLREPYPPEVALRLEDGYLAHLGARVGRALPTWNRSILNEIYLRKTPVLITKLRMETPGQGGLDAACRVSVDATRHVEFGGRETGQSAMQMWQCVTATPHRRRPVQRIEAATTPAGGGGGASTGEDHGIDHNNNRLRFPYDSTFCDSMIFPRARARWRSRDGAGCASGRLGGGGSQWGWAIGAERSRA